MPALGLADWKLVLWQIPDFRFAGFTLRVRGVAAPAKPVPIVSAASPISDVDLFARVRWGDPAAFAEFYDRHSALLFGIALKILGNEHDAEDVLQEAAVLIWERSPRYDAAVGQPLSWAVALTRNKAIDHLRSARRRNERVEEAAREPITVLAPELDSPKQAIAVESGESVQSALGSLSSEQRQAIELAFFYGLTQLEIAARLGQPLGTIKARIRRGMMAMRDLLEDQA